jgi:hypothetical protein
LHWVSGLLLLTLLTLVPSAGGEVDQSRLWTDRALASLSEIELDHNLQSLIYWIEYLHPALLTDPRAADFRKKIDQAAVNSGRDTAEKIKRILDRLDRGPLQADTPPLLWKANVHLEELRNNPQKTGVYNVTSDIINAGSERKLTDAELAPFLDAFETTAKDQNDDATWGATALTYQRLAREAADQGLIDRSNAHADRMVQILVTHPAYQDISRGNTDASDTFHTPGLLLRLQRREDVAKLAEAAREDHARELWIALAGHLAESGDMDSARQVIDEQLKGPADAKAAEAMKSAIDGKPVALDVEKEKNFDHSTLARSILAVASGYAKRGDVPAALRVAQVGQTEPWQQVDLHLSFSKSALDSDQTEAAREFMLNAWKLYKDTPRKNIHTLGKLAMASVQAGLPDQFVMEIVSVQSSHAFVEPLVAMARRNREAGNDAECLRLIGRAKRLAESTPPGDGGSTHNLMIVAAEYHAMGDNLMVDNLTLRSALLCEDMRDPYFFAPGAYLSLVDTCQKMNRPELIERSYGVLSFPEDQAIFALAVLRLHGKK